MAPALVEDLIDLSHPAALKFLRGRDAEASSPAERPPAPARPGRPPRAAPVDPDGPSPDRPPPPDDGTSAQAASFGSLTVDQVVEIYGGVRQYNDWLDSRLKSEKLRSERLKNEETEGALIERDFVKTHILAKLETLNRRLLGDAPKTLARTLYALANSKEPIEQGEISVRDIISKILASTQAQVTAAIRDA